MRVVFWSIWLSFGLLIILLLGSIVTIMIKTSIPETLVQPRFDVVDTIVSTSQEPIENEYVQEKIKILYGRKGYSNPKPTSEDEDYNPNITTRERKRTRRPLKIIGKDFNPYGSYTIKHPNGTLTYVFPSQKMPSSTTPTINRFGVDSNPTILIDKNVSGEPVRAYPTEQIDKIMAKHKSHFEGAFGDDMVNGDKLNQRFDTSDDIFFCDSKEVLIHPLEGISWKNSSELIVNTDNFKQGVRIETCRNEGQPCRYGDGNTVCKQLYHYRTMVVINLNEENPYKELILLPSCCKCARKSFLGY